MPAAKILHILDPNVCVLLVMILAIVLQIQDMTKRNQYGHIVNISSMSGHRVPNGASGGSFYAATKHAVRALTEGLRQEVGL